MSDQTEEIAERWFGILASTKTIPFSQAKKDIESLLAMVRDKAEDNLKLNALLESREKEYNLRVRRLGEKLLDECMKEMTEWNKHQRDARPVPIGASER